MNTLEARPMEAAAPVPAALPKPASKLPKRIALAGALVYGLGMFGAMVGSALLNGEWGIALLVVPQAALAVMFGAGAMGLALLAPDPYVAEPGHPPAKLPDFS